MAVGSCRFALGIINAPRCAWQAASQWRDFVPFPDCCHAPPPPPSPSLPHALVTPFPLLLPPPPPPPTLASLPPMVCKRSAVKKRGQRGSTLQNCRVSIITSVLTFSLTRDCARGLSHTYTHTRGHARAPPPPPPPPFFLLLLLI